MRWVSHGMTTSKVSTNLNVFTPEECAKIVEVGLSKPLDWGGHYPPEEAVRKSKIRFIFTQDEPWIFERLLGDNPNNYQLYSVQFTEYKRSYNGWYAAHRDTPSYSHPNKKVTHVRRLTAVVQLSDPNTYSGGDLIFPEDDLTATREQGSVVTFPAMTLHQLNKVTKGTRYSLVAWFMGPKDE